MAPTRSDGYDALSMHTLDDYSVVSPSDGESSATLIEYDQEPSSTAKKEIPQPSSPSRSSFFSSPAMTATDWTPDTNSEFSYEAAPLLGNETPPPEYESPRASLTTIRPSGVCRLRSKIFGARCARNAGQSKYDACGDSRCSRRRKMAKVAHICIALFLTSAIIFFCTMTSFRHRHKEYRHKTPALPKWAHDCVDDDRYNYYSFDGVRDLDISDGARHAFSGTIKILPALPNQSVDLIIKTLPKTKHLNIKVNDRDVADSMHSHATTRSGSSSGSTLDARSPQKLQKRRRCGGSAHVILHFREGLSIANLGLSTSSGAIQVHSSLAVSNTTTISTKTAKLEASLFFNTRKTYISSDSSSLQGVFRLYDVLSIKSTSGSIDVTVDPQEVDAAHPKPAELIVASLSGRVKLDTTHTPPPREYLTTIESRDGMVQGNVLHGSKTLIKSVSGMVQVDVLPYIFKGASSDSSLHVVTVSGRQEVRLRSPPSGSLTQMKSVHSSESGSLQLKYPAEWAGSISGSTDSGAIHLKGNGVSIIDQGAHFVKAEKSEGDSEVVFKATSGSAQLEFES